MRVLYVDVYFLINFTVDIISAFIAVKLLHIKTSFARLLLISSVGALAAVADVLIGDEALFTLVLGVLFLGLAVIIIAGGVSFVRRVKFLVVFLCTEMLLGGAVSYIYRVLDRYTERIGEYFKGGSTNRKALLFSVVILLAIGVLKLFIMVFSNEGSVKSARVSIRVGDSSVECEALVDSGNLVRDPMNMNPVVFIKEDLAKKLLPVEVIELSGIDTLDNAYRKRIRLIPVTRGDATHVLTGFLPDEVSLEENSGAVDVTLAIDREGGTYGGMDVLLPSCIVGI